MSWRRRWNRCKALFRRRRIEAELDEEIRAHLEMEEDEQRAAGLPPEDARQAARRRFGNVTLAREDSRQAWVYRRLETLGRDVRHALRMLAKAPGFTAVAVLTLALGIGATTAIFTLLDQILLRVLPVAEPQQLVLLTMRGRHYGDNYGGNSISYPMFRDFQDTNQVFSGMFARRPTRVNLGFDGRSERVAAELVSGSYFEVLGVRAAAGRLIAPGDDRVPEGHPLLVLAHSYWQTRFAADPGIVGKTLVVNNRSFTVIGVAGPGFRGVELGHDTQLFVPLAMQEATMFGRPGMLRDRRVRWVNAFGRLAPGVGMQHARASLQPLMQAMLQREVREPAFSKATVEARTEFLKCWMDLLPGSQGRAATRLGLATPLWALMAAAGFVLLIACANLANLLLARGTARRRELAVRMALGAGRGRVVGQLLTESLVLSALGATCGLLVAVGATRLLVALYLPADPFGLKVSTVPDARILLFALAVTFVTALGFGLAPALRSTSSGVTEGLKQQSGAVAGGPHARLRSLLAVAQVTISLVLLIGAGLFLQSLHNLRALGPGFPTARLIGFKLDPSLGGYDTDRAKQFYQRLTEQLGALPGVQAVGLAAVRILEEDWDGGLTVQGYAPADPGARRHAQPYMNAISPGYFATLGVPLVAGRDFTRSDDRQVLREHPPGTLGSAMRDSSPTAVIVNETFARRYFPGQNPLGRHLGFGTDPGTPTPMEVIGVVKDIKYLNLRDDVREQAFFPYLGYPLVRAMTVHLRVQGDTGAVLAAVRDTVNRLDPAVPIFGLRSMDAHLDQGLANERMIAGLSTVFGLLATLLAVIGLYGVMSYAVAARTRELGIRLALGARRERVLALVMRQVLLLVTAGVAGGIAAALALTRLLSSQLYGVRPSDPSTVVLAAALLALTACLAGYLPARRASRVDPMVALRSE